MSLGGWLVVMDRAGRDVKNYRLGQGSVTLGSDPICDIRVMVPTVSPHHATVVALHNQTIVRSVSDRETLVNGAPISVAALRHGDVISLGGRNLRWEYRVPGVRRPLAPEPALLRRVQRARAPRRGSEPPPRNVIVPEHRASMPASTSGKQVAIVQPQRRDTSDLGDAISPRLPANKRPRTSRNVSNHIDNMESVDFDNDKTKRKSVGSPRNVPNLSTTTKATLWIESRKTSPRKSTSKIQTPAKTPVRTPAVRKHLRKAVSAKKTTPLRMVVLKKAQSAQKMKVTKIQAPLKMDSTKQAAIMLMTRHTPKSKQTSPNQGNKGPLFVVKKPSPVKEALKQKRSSVKRASTSGSSNRQSSLIHRISNNSCPSVIEITDSETQSSTRESSVTRRSKGSLRSPPLSSPKKSALKDPNAKNRNRKTETIKFDLSNLDNTQDQNSDVMLVNETGNNSYTDNSESDFTLRFSDTSSKSPSPRKSINSRSSRMLEQSLGTSVTLSPKSDRKTLTAESPRTKKSLRGSIILQEALRINNSDGTEISTYSRRTTESLSDQSWSTTVASTRQTRTLSPRVSRSNLESYSIVDLVSIDSNDSITSKSGSVYTSADSTRSETYDTPGLQKRITSVSRRAPGCSTPYDLKNQPAIYDMLDNSTRTRKHKDSIGNVNTSVTTPENSEDTTKNITLNSTKISRTTKKRFQITARKNVVIVMDDELSEDDSSPKSSKRISKGSRASPMIPKSISLNETPATSPSINGGVHTPENRHSPVEASTPVLSIQSLLDASQNSNKSPNSRRKKILKRKTIGVLHSEPRRSRRGTKSKSLNFGGSGRGRGILASFDGSDDSTQNVEEEEIVTPKSVVKPLPEGVKNKHSSAKKPQSKRSLIDNLNESDIVKQLFNSPVKRKLSQSMTEFSRRHLFEDDEDVPRRPTRATIAVDGRSPDYSLLDHTEPFTPDIFVSPLNTPSNTPNMLGIKRLFQKSTPDNDLRNVRGVKDLLRTPRTRNSIKNDLSNISGIKRVFAKSPRNRLSDVRIKKIFAASPKNDLKQVSGIKDLFKSQRRKGKSPRNVLDDLRGVRNLFTEDASQNDLRNISGVKRILRCNSPRNDLTDVRGVKRMFRQEKQRDEFSDISGVEQLFHESTNYDSTFDQLLGRPPIRSVYTKSKSFTTTSNVQKKGKSNKSKTKSLHDVSLITNNVEEWLQKELAERLHRNAPAETSNSKGRKSLNKSKNVSKTMRELQKLNTDTVDGSVPVIINRTRNSTILNNVQSDISSRKKSASELYGAHTLPIKKRSLVEMSTNKSSNDRSHKLPIKKRAVVHSTPVKGRVNVTMNASEINRMSPICSEDKSIEVDNIIRSPQRPVSSKTKSPPGKTMAIAGSPLKEKSLETVKLSPKKTRSAKSRRSPVAVRARRGKKSNLDNQEVINIKKRRSSLVITKKAPVLSPKPSPKVTRKGTNKRLELNDVHKISPKKIRSTRSQKSQISVEVKNTPKKNTRAKIIRTSVIVSKPSPKVNIRATRNTKNRNTDLQTDQPELQTKRTRKMITTEPEVRDESNKNTQTTKELHVEVEPKRKIRKMFVESELKVTVVDKSIIQTRRTRRILVETVQNVGTNDKRKAQNKRGSRNTEVQEATTVEELKPIQGKNIQPQSSMEIVTRPGRRAKTNVNVQESNKGRKRRTTVKESAPKPIEETVEMLPTRSRRNKQEIQFEVNKEVGIEELPRTRGRKRKNTEQNDPVIKDTVGKKETRSTKSVEKADNATNKAKLRNVSRRRAGDASDDNSQKLSTSGPMGKAKTGNAVDVKIKGKKTTTVAAVVGQAGGRKKRTNMEISDAKENKKEPAKKPRKAAVTSPAARATRARNSTRAAAVSLTGAASTGRARRR